ncbi:hypothetical protein HYV87_04020 [Candidatus Woesearchaeota archaeon]|nr:hypothetical protein [Candidatus Woesearchaeota archaeon]MBI2582262.1 hypothetical protein [Candidatus Woesearchaeota archaeon]
MIYPCSYNNLLYCFEKRALPKVGPITPEIREKIVEAYKRYGREMEPILKVLEDCSRVTHHDLSITINSPEPKYLKSE